MISVVVPSYKNPNCLDICIKSFLDTQDNITNELICIIDGYPDMYQHIQKLYYSHTNIHILINDQNKGMPFSINRGVYHAVNSKILVINDDNVFPMSWDSLLGKYNDPNLVISPNQIERNPSIFNFIQYDFGGVDDFRYKDFLTQEPFMRKDELSNDGEIFPFLIDKKLFMAVGGFDLIYPSPFVCDWDFFLKLEILGINFARTRAINFYHFGSIATKKSADKHDANKFSESEQLAAHIFLQKWGFYPSINRPSNSHKPIQSQTIKGILFI